MLFSNLASLHRGLAFAALPCVGGAAPLATAPTLPLGLDEVGRVYLYQGAHQFALFFEEQGNFLDYDPSGTVVTINDFLVSFSADWNRAATAASSATVAFAPMTQDTTAPAGLRVEVWRNFVDLTLGLKAIALDMADGHATDYAAYLSAADAYGDFGTLLPSISATLTPAAVQFAAAETALGTLGQAIYYGTVDDAPVAFLKGLMDFHKTQLAIAAALFDLTDSFTPAGPNSGQTHPVEGQTDFLSITDVLQSSTPWSLHAQGYQVGGVYLPLISVWLKESTLLRTTNTTSVTAGYTSNWTRFFGVGGHSFQTSNSTSTALVFSGGGDATVGTLP